MNMLTQYPDAPDIESSTAAYAKRFDSNVGGWFLEQQHKGTLKLIEKAGELKEGLSILDVGGGHGQNIPLAKKINANLTLLGSNQQCFDFVKNSAHAQSIKFVEGKLHDLPFPDNSFDIVLCYRIIAHSARYTEIIEELNRVANKLVIIDYTSSMSINALSEYFFNIKKRIEKNTRIYQRHNCREINQFVTSIQAKPLASYKQYFFPMVIYRFFNSTKAAKMLEYLPRILGLSHLLGSPILYAFSTSNQSTKHDRQ